MNCPYCNKLINAMTGFQEIQKFKKHLIKCKKNPERLVMVDEKGGITNLTSTSLLKALNIRAESGQ